MKTIPLSTLANCNNPAGIDFIPLLDMDGGISGLPRAKKLSLSILSALIAQSVTGIIRDSCSTVTDQFLVNNQSEDIEFDLPNSFLLISAISNIPARLRLYCSNNYRDEDRGRSGEDDPNGDHGCITEIVFSSDTLFVTLLPIVFGSVQNLTCPAIFDSKSIIPEKGIISFIYLPIEV